jgi:hypothetical protein
MDDDRIDFSALDPHAGPARLERGVQDVLRRLARRPSPLWLDVVGRGRLALAMSLLLAVASWVPAWLGSASGRSTESPSRDLLTQVDEWARAGSIPSNVNLLEALGGSDER